MSTSSTTIAHYPDLIRLLENLRAQDEGAPVALILGKLEGLQSVNGRYGYPAGDSAIAQFYEGLRGIARDDDLVLQISGTAFAFAIFRPLHTGHVMLAADRIVQLAENWISLSEVRFRLGVSLGCGLIDQACETTGDLLGQADAALNLCRRGDKAVHMWDASLAGTVACVTHPEFDAHKAIENGEFRLHYQPQLCLSRGALVGAEALVRWSAPDGLIMPASFMSELEHTRSLKPLLQFVINNTSREMARWLRRMPELTVSVNVSGADLEDADLAQLMQEMLAMWNLAPEHLNLEISEKNLTENPAQGLQTLTALRQLGVRTTIDDFGVGCSSFAWLKELPVDEIKIDSSFVQGVLDDPKDRHIVATIIDFAHGLDIHTTAVGVESSALASALRDMGCDSAQGFLYSEPLTANEFEKVWLSRDNIETALTE